MKYVVPQFIDVEDKIMGPITTRQFIILMVTFFFGFIFYKLFDFSLFLLVTIPTVIIGGIIAFMKINGQPFHYFMLNLLQTMRRPSLRVWDKEPDHSDLLFLVRRPPPPPPKARIKKEVLAATKLTELTLVVNTGGVYNPED
jgi:hypothetical protein